MPHTEDTTPCFFLFAIIDPNLSPSVSCSVDFSSFSIKFSSFCHILGSKVFFVCLSMSLATCLNWWYLPCSSSHRGDSGITKLKMEKTVILENTKYFQRSSKLITIRSFSVFYIRRAEILLALGVKLIEDSLSRSADEINRLI